MMTLRLLYKTKTRGAPGLNVITTEVIVVVICTYFCSEMFS